MDDGMLVKLWLHDNGEDVESVWAEPCGQSEDARLYRIANIPFLHAKPTIDDVVAAAPDTELGYPLAWNRRGRSYERISEALHHDSGRYAAIIDYPARSEAQFQSATRWLRELRNVKAEGAWGPSNKKPGRLYLAVPKSVAIDRLCDEMKTAYPAFDFDLVHPK